MKYKSLKIVEDLLDSSVYYDDDTFPGVYVEGYTVGCGCCSDHKDVTEESLDAHISQLEASLAEAQEIKAKFFA